LSTIFLEENWMEKQRRCAVCGFVGDAKFFGDGIKCPMTTCLAHCKEGVSPKTSAAPKKEGVSPKTSAAPKKELHGVAAVRAYVESLKNPK
jgi:hypothetical protein